MIGIYKVIYLPENKVVYVGQSVDIKKRFRQHKYYYNNPKELGYNSHFYRTLRKYGIDNFQFELIEECSVEELNDKEIYWIAYFDTFNNRCNSTIGGQHMAARNLTNEEIRELKKDLAENKLSYNEMSHKFGVSNLFISQVNKGILYPDENVNIIRILGVPNKSERCIRPKIKKYCELCGKEINVESRLCLDCYAKEKLRQNSNVSEEELINLLKENQRNFEKVGKQIGISRSAIKKRLKGKNLPYLSSDYRPKKEKGYNPPPKRVAKLDKETDEIVQVFGSIWEAEKGLPSGVISRVINGRRKAYHGDKYIQISEEVYQDFLNKQNQSKTNLN